MWIMPHLFSFNLCLLNLRYYFTENYFLKIVEIENKSKNNKLIKDLKT